MLGGGGGIISSLMSQAAYLSSPLSGEGGGVPEGGY